MCQEEVKTRVEGAEETNKEKGKNKENIEKKTEQGGAEL